jgi:hypothetical protein
MVVCNRTKPQLQATDNYYRAMPINNSQKTLSEKLKSELGGNYCQFMRYLVDSRHAFNGETVLKVTL